MAGIYIHIPFCKSKCYYCNFYSVVLKDNDNKLKSKYLEALMQEIELRANFFKGERIDTIYFGGGTPSQLSVEQINQVIAKLYQTFSISKNVEITMEVNPDDFTYSYAYQIKEKTNINRLSLGVQSFVEKDLKVLGRRHGVKEIYTAIRNAKYFDFQNITIDIIYGIPHSLPPFESLEFNIKRFIELDIPHLSAYNLTIEPNTRFGKYFKIGKLKPIDEETLANLFEYIVKTMEKKGYIHYEISNFARKDFFSRHNFSYWTGVKYLGLGTSAHSYDGNFRYWNKPKIHDYIIALSENKLTSEVEKLTDKDKYNEYILTRLRTYLGINLAYIEKNYKEFFPHLLKLLKQYEQKSFIYQNKSGNFVLTLKGKLIADSIIAELFF